MEPTGDASDVPAVMNDPGDDVLRAWLLHRLADEPLAATLEQRVLEDDAFGMRLRAIEIDLVDDYARRQLDEEDRAAVARWLLATPRDRMRLHTAVALGKTIDLQRAVAPLPPPADSRVRQRRQRVALLAFAAAATLVLAVLGLQYRDLSRKAPVDSFAANTPTITLLASLQRGVQGTPGASVRIPRDAPSVRLQVEVADGDAGSRYALQLTGAHGQVFAAQGLVPRTSGPYRFVEVAITSALLGSGDYRVGVTFDGAAQPLQEWTLHTQTD
jgi:hypothetical protein